MSELVFDIGFRSLFKGCFDSAIQGLVTACAQGFENRLDLRPKVFNGREVG
jgi:hypothetical protein